MPLWEYKVITSGKGGFATPALLEKFLNDLGRDEWEIIHFQTPPDNSLAFTGLVRRSTQRDWTLEDAAAAAAKAEAEKLRAEFEAKFRAAASNVPAAEERAPSFLEEKVAPDDGFRKPVDTSHDDDPEAQDDEKADEWDKLAAAEEDDLPTFFEAIKPHMRRNQRGPGMSVGVDYLAKKWDQTEEDLKGALLECGFVMPEDEDTKPEYLEYDGDLYWLNINRRGELWINTKEKPRPVFRPVKAQKITIEEPAKPQPAEPRSQKSDTASEKPEDPSRQPEVTEAAAAETASTERAEKPEGRPASGGSSQPLPSGSVLLDKIRPHMRRNRRGPGGSGSTSFLSRALRTNEAELKTAFAALGLTLPTAPNDKPVYSEFGNELWWLNLDSRGGLWINGREKRDGETSASAAAKDEKAEAPLESVPGANAADAVPAPDVAPSVQTTTPAEAPAAAAPAEPAAEPSALAAPSPESSLVKREVAPEPLVAETRAPAAASGTAPSEAAAPSNHPALAAVRLLLKETKTGSVAGKIDRLAEELGKSPDELVATLVDAGLKVPEKPREKPAFVPHAGEILWFNKNAKGELWLNAKPSKFAEKEGLDEADDAEGASTGESGETEAEGENGKRPNRRGGRSRAKKTETEGS